MKQVKWFTQLVLSVLLLSVLFQACENDLNQVRQISSKELNTQIDSTKGADLIYSDSARVKAHVLSPLMLNHQVTAKIPEAFYEMTQGVKIIFFDTKLNIKQLKEDPTKHIVCTVTADYAITSNANKIFTMRRNVIVVNNLGDTFKSEELIWDSIKKEVYTNKPCQINKVDGTSGTGTSFHSNETFTDYIFKDGRGDIVLRGNSGF